MANTIRTYTGDGVTTLYPIDFELGYLRKEFVYVYTGEDFNTQLTYSWVSGSQIELNEPVPTGTEFSIRRIIPRDELINDYEDRAIFKKKNLNDSHRQHLMLIEEIQDGYFSVSGLATFLSDVAIKGDITVEDLTVEGHSSLQTVDVNGNPITNVGTPSNGADAANKDYVDAFIAAINNIQAVVPLYSRAVADGINNVYEVPSKEGFLLSASSYMLFLDGVKQYPITDYTIDGSQLTVIDTPSEGTIVDVIFFEPATVGTVLNKTVTIEGQGVVPVDAPRILGDGTTVEYAIPVSELTEAEDSSYNVFLDGVKQRVNIDYTINGALLTFTEAPSVGTAIDITFYEPNVFKAEDDWGSVANPTTEPDDDFGTL